MVDWPQSLIKEISRRRCILFLGAGISASAVDGTGNHPLGWRDFLLEASELVRNRATKEDITQLISERRFLLALDAIKTEVDNSDYQDFLSNHFNNPTFSPSTLHQIILELDSRLVITTNFDKIYEKKCLSTSDEGFKVICYDSESLADELRSDTRLIIKAHGSIDNVRKMIFTKSEYHNAKRNHPHFYEILKAIFLTHTVIFAGCSLDDPDVLLMLEDVKVSATSLRPHYALVKTGEHSKYMLSDWDNSYNIKALEYGPEYSDLSACLEDLLQQVKEVRQIHPES